MTKKVVHLLEDRPGYTMITTEHGDAVMHTVPDAERVSVVGGMHNIVVPHTQAVSEQLASLRAPHLPPMVTDYHWQASFTPFPHQYRMAGTMSTHKRFFCLADPGCVDGETEYLSPTGWKRIDSYKAGRVMQYDPRTGVGEFVKPEAYIDQPCNEMLHFCDGVTFDQMLTPDHNMLYHQRKYAVGGGYACTTRVAAASDVAKAHLEYGDGFRGRIPTAFRSKGKTPVHRYHKNHVALMALCICFGRLSDDGTLWELVAAKRSRVHAVCILASAPSIVSVEYTSARATAAVFVIRHAFMFKTIEQLYALPTDDLSHIIETMSRWCAQFPRDVPRNLVISPNKRAMDLFQFALVATGIKARICEVPNPFDATNDTPWYRVSRHASTTEASAQFKSRFQNAKRGVDTLTVSRAVPVNNRKYCFTVPSGYLVLRRNNKVFCTGNTGKTVGAVWAVDYLKSIGRTKRVLIIAPLSLLTDTWQREFLNAAPNLKVVVLHGSAVVRRKRTKEPHDVAIINYDGVSVVYDELVYNKYDVVVYDESTYIKHINRRWKFCYGVSRSAEWVWLLTGTPVAQAPTDAFGQCKMVHGAAFPFTESAWKEATMRQVSEFKWVPRPEATQLVQKWMQPSIYIRKRDVLKDLPPITVQRRRVEVSSEQHKVLTQLKKDSTAIATNGGIITAVHAAALNAKILQVASGTVYDEFHNVVVLDNAPRISELISIVAETRLMEDLEDTTPNNKVLVFCMFKHTIQAVTDSLRKAGFMVEIVTGDVSPTKRAVIFRDFQDKRTIDVLVAIPDVAAHGLTLTAASATVWFTPVASNEDFMQAMNRMDRPGQKYPMSVYELYGTEAERLMYDRAAERKAHQIDVLQAYKELVSFL